MLILSLFSCQWTRETKYPHAVWAAGRGLVALLLPDFDVVDQIWLDPTSWDVRAYLNFTSSTFAGHIVWIITLSKVLTCLICRASGSPN